jgi:hypothetical protein
MPAQDGKGSLPSKMSRNAVNSARSKSVMTGKEQFNFLEIKKPT